MCGVPDESVISEIVTPVKVGAVVSIHIVLSLKLSDSLVNEVCILVSTFAELSSVNVPLMLVTLSLSQLYILSYGLMQQYRNCKSLS